MRSTLEMHKYTCDNCGSVAVVEPDDERPHGFYLDVGYIHEGGGDGAEDVFACKESCIKGAVLKALDDRGRR